MKVVIILPTYNEKENIAKLIPRLEEEIFPSIKNHQMSILVADDNSPDGTSEETRKLMKKWKNINIVSGEKQGLGAAYIRGMMYAIEKMDTDIIFEMDADGQHDPTKIPQFLKRIDEGYDMVIGTRYSDGGSIPQNWPPQRKAFSIVANLFVRTVFMRFSIHDWTGGYRALKKEVFLKEKDELIKYNGYIFQISFLHKAIQDGFKIAEVPFHFTDRLLGKSKIAPADYILDILQYVIIARIMELKRVIKFLFVGGTGFIIQIIAQEGSLRIGMSLAIAFWFAEAQAYISHGTMIISGHSLNALSQGVAAGVGAEFAILSNFLLNNFWTFNDTHDLKGSSPFVVRLVKFNITSLLAILIQGVAVGVGVKVIGNSFSLLNVSIPTRIAVLFPTIILFIIPLNYIIYNKLIWKTQNLKKE